MGTNVIPFPRVLLGEERAEQLAMLIYQKLGKGFSGPGEPSLYRVTYDGITFQDTSRDRVLESLTFYLQLRGE